MVLPTDIIDTCMDLLVHRREWLRMGTYQEEPGGEPTLMLWEEGVHGGDLARIGSAGFVVC